MFGGADLWVFFSFRIQCPSLGANRKRKRCGGAVLGPLAWRRICSGAANNPPIQRRVSRSSDQLTRQPFIKCWLLQSPIDSLQKWKAGKLRFTTHSAGNVGISMRRLNVGARRARGGARWGWGANSGSRAMQILWEHPGPFAYLVEWCACAQRAARVAN